MINALEGKSMNGMAVGLQLKKTVTYVLDRMTRDAKLAYLMGFGTQSFSLLTESYATAINKPVREVRENMLEAIGKLDTKAAGTMVESVELINKLEAQIEALEDQISELENRPNPSTTGISLSELVNKLLDIRQDASLPGLVETNINDIEATSKYVVLT